MEEFKVIPLAPDYKMNKEGEVRRIINDKPLLILGGGKVILKKEDGTMQHFVVEDLVKELFYTKIEFGSSEDQPAIVLKTEGEIVPDDVSQGTDTTTVILQDYTTTDISVPPTPVSEILADSSLTKKEISEIEENNTNESEDKDLINEPAAEIVSQHNEQPKTESKREVAWTHIGKTIAGKSPKGMEKKKEKKEKVAKVKSVNKKEEKVAKTFTTTKEISKIIELDCSESMKIWKLHQAGCSIDEIVSHLNLPKKKKRRCYNSIWNYEHNKKIRDKADLK